MKRLCLLFCFTVFAFLAKAQKGADDLSFKAYQNYTLGTYLNTPYSNLRTAGVKWQEGDSAAAFFYVQKAIKAGLFDSTMIVNAASLDGFTQTTQWPLVKKGIEKNISAISRPENLKIVTSDVERFVKLYPRLLTKNSSEQLWRNYIVNGSTGLKTFFNVRMSSRPDLVLNIIKKRRRFYAGLQPLVQQLPSFSRQLQVAAQDLEALYPDAVFPPIYFLVGNLDAAGTADGGAGQLVGLEFFSGYAGRDTSELNTWERSVLSDTGRLVGVVVHEMIHVQQRGPSAQTVLAKCIAEGAADFITWLLLHKIILPRQHAYGNAHEKELFDRLLKEKNTTDLAYWMYNTAMEEKGIPSDLGYYMGFKICEAYYTSHSDKRQAVKDILQVEDTERFLKESGYEKALASR